MANAKHRNKRTPFEREADLLEIAKLYLAHKSHEQIAAQLSAMRPYQLSRAQISYDIRTLVTRWRAESVRTIDDQKAEELKRINAVEATAWESWAKSQSPSSVKRQNRTLDKNGVPGTGHMTIEQQDRDGDSRFLSLVMQCSERRCRLLGIEAPQKINLGGPDGKPIAPTVVAPVVNFIIPDNGRTRTQPTIVPDADTAARPGGNGGNGNGGNGH